LVVLCFALLGCASAQLGRIVGGSPTTIEARPYQASLQYRTILGTYSHSCGASIISPKFLISAAHCAPSASSLASLYARVGSTVYNSGGQIIKVDKYVIHPQYNGDILDFDFGIVSFAAGVEIILGPNVQVIKLSSGEDPAVGSSIIVSGWGVLTETSSSVPTILQEVSLPVWDNDRCRSVYSFVTPRQTCCGGTSIGGTSACFGDSGGPVVQEFGSSLVQYALVSGGNSCTQPNIPGIYAKISSVRPWITEQTGV